MISILLGDIAYWVELFQFAKAFYMVSRITKIAPYLIQNIITYKFFFSLFSYYR